jgi:high-affinity Fe2+/Pb2+ permease
MSRWIVQNVPAWWLVVLAVVVLPTLAVLIQWLIRRRASSLASGPMKSFRSARLCRSCISSVTYGIFSADSAWPESVATARDL